MFPTLTPETAAPRVRPALTHAQRQFGFIPSPLARMASSPTAVEAFSKLLGLFDQSSLGALEREVVALTVARVNGCHYCMAMHSALLSRSSEGQPVVPALREGAPLAEPRLEALRQFVLTLLDTRGAVGPEAERAFTAAGFDAQQALDVVVGVAAYTLSTFANRLTAAPLDAAFEAHRWHAPA
jgi:uncharacterized peroxidase-related enzyme